METGSTVKSGQPIFKLQVTEGGPPKAAAAPKKEAPAAAAAPPPPAGEFLNLNFIESVLSKRPKVLSIIQTMSFWKHSL